MVNILALALVHAAAAVPAEEAFVEGRIDCQVIERTGGIRRLSFELADQHVVVREGAGFAANGAETWAGLQHSSALSLRQRARYFFSDQSSAPAFQFELVETVDAGYRAIRLAVTKAVSVPMGHGIAPTQWRLEAAGMCEPASRQEISQVRP